MLAKKGTFFSKKGHHHHLQFNPFLSVLHQNKVLLNFHKRGQRLIAGRLLVPIHLKIWYFHDVPRLIPAKIDFFRCPLNLIAPNYQLWWICRSFKISSLKVIKYQVPELNKTF